MDVVAIIDGCADWGNWIIFARMCVGGSDDGAAMEECGEGGLRSGASCSSGRTRHCWGLEVAKTVQCQSIEELNSFRTPVVIS